MGKRKKVKLYRNKEWLEQKHLGENLSIAEIAGLAGCKKGDTVRKWLLKYDIPIHICYPEVEVDKAWLQDQYVNQEKTMRAIAEIKQCSIATIRKKLIKFGIPIRSNTEARKLYWKENFVDRVNERYNNLTIIEYAGQTERQLHLWKCRCDCGNETITTYNNLNKSHVGSCGCARNKYTPDIAAFKNLFSQYKAQANQRNLEFSLTLQQFENLTSADCYYCGQSPESIIYLEYNDGRYAYNGIDRLDSSKGYVSGNIVTSCKRCNVAKGILSEEEFLDWVINVYEYQNGSTNV